jgi:hypothetical protein
MRVFEASQPTEQEEKNTALLTGCFALGRLPDAGV